MADFSNIPAEFQRLQDGKNMLDNFRTLYNHAKAIRSLLTRYSADAAFKAEVDHLFTPVQRSELAGMIAQVNTLLTDWEANHTSALGLDTP